MENKQNGSSSNLQKAENNPPSTQTAPDEQHPSQEYRNLVLPDFNSEFLQNHQLPNETEEQMVDRLLEEVEHITRGYDRIQDEIQQQCDEIDAEFERLDHLLEEFGIGALDFATDTDDDENASQEVNASEVGAEVEEPMEEEVINSGLAEEVILENLSGAEFQAQHQHEEDLCCICQGAYEGGEEKRKLGCGHTFHYDCIRRWLLMKNSCPLCNRPVFNLH